MSKHFGRVEGARVRVELTAFIGPAGGDPRRLQLDTTPREFAALNKKQALKLAAFLITWSNEEVACGLCGHSTTGHGGDDLRFCCECEGGACE